MYGPQIQHCLFTFRQIAKQLKSSTTIETPSLLGRAMVSALGARGPGFNSQRRQGLLCFILLLLLLLLLLLCFYFLSKHTLFVTTFAIPFVILTNLVFLTDYKDIQIQT